MSDDMQLAGLRALVTGGTQGTGAAVVARLRMAGAAMLITARHQPAQLPEGVLFAAADLATAAGCAAVADQGAPVVREPQAISLSAAASPEPRCVIRP